MDFGLFHPNTIDYEFWTNFDFNTIGYDVGLVFHFNTIEYEFWPNFHPNPIDFGF